MRAVAAVADGRGRRARVRRLDRRRAGRLAVHASSARAASTGPRWRSSCPVPGAPFLLLDAGANVEVRPEHLVQFAHMGAAFMEAVGGRRVAARGAALQRRRSRRKGTEIVVAAHGVAGGLGGPELRRQRRGLRDRDRRGRRDRRRRLHRQRRAEGDGGRRPRRCSARCATPRCPRCARRPAACCCGPRCAGCATELDPRSRAARCCSACASSAVVPHGSFGARGVHAGDRGRGARRARGRGRAHATPGWRRRGRSGRASEAAASVPDEP